MTPEEQIAREESKLKVWITKYALTRGIYEIEAEDCGDGMIRGEHYSYFFGEGKEWHRDRASARERAYAMKNARLQSLDKSREKLLRLTFE